MLWKMACSAWILICATGNGISTVSCHSRVLLPTLNSEIGSLMPIAEDKTFAAYKTYSGEIKFNCKENNLTRVECSS